MLGIDEGTDAALGLRIGDRMQRNGRLTARFRTVDLNDPASGKTPDAECHIERDRAGGDHFDLGMALVSQPHDRALTVLLLNLGECCLEGFLAICNSHLPCPLYARCALEAWVVDV